MNCALIRPLKPTKNEEILFCLALFDQRKGGSSMRRYGTIPVTLSGVPRNQEHQKGWTAEQASRGTTRHHSKTQIAGPGIRRNPVAEVPARTDSRERPRTAAQNQTTFGSRARVLVRIVQEIGVGLVSAAGPFPHVAHHVVAAIRAAPSFETPWRADPAHSHLGVGVLCDEVVPPWTGPFRERVVDQIGRDRPQPLVDRRDLGNCSTIKA
jgi:hypothetical protein